VLLSYIASVSPFSEPAGIDTKQKYAAMSEALHSYGSYLTQCLPKFIQQYSILRDELTLYVAPSAIVPVLTFLRDHTQCQYAALMDISGADYPSRREGGRFEVVYHLLSVRFASRIRVKTYADEVTLVPSVIGVFRGADW
jgi:NADH dehydrogenase (ubiquinone) Fe-S protein 3